MRHVFRPRFTGHSLRRLPGRRSIVLFAGTTLPSSIELANGSYTVTGQILSPKSHRLLSHTKQATSVTVNIGTLASGDVSSTFTSDDARLIVNEALGVGPTIDIEFTFRGVVNEQLSLFIEGYYSGNAAHIVKTQIYNTSGSWENITANTRDLPSTASDTEYTFPLPADLTNYVSSGVLRVKIVHTSNGASGHTLNIDKIALINPAGSYTTTGQSVSTLLGRYLSGEYGSYLLSGNAIGLLIGRTVSPEYGQYSLTGVAAGTLVGKLLSPEYGQYSLSGQSGILIIHRTVSGEYGQYALNGQDIGLSYHPISGPTYILICSQGVYTLSGQQQGLYAHRSSQLDYGGYLLSGQQSAIIPHRFAGLLQGSYVLSGQQLGTYARFRLPTVPGTYALTGQEVQLLLDTDVGFEEVVQQSLIVGL